MALNDKKSFRVVFYRKYSMNQELPEYGERSFKVNFFNKKHRKEYRRKIERKSKWSQLEQPVLVCVLLLVVRKMKKN